jgi:hypothetical protein
MNLTSQDGEYLLYIEVRDFQKNVQVGYKPVSLYTDDSVVVDVSPNTYLPCFAASK